MLEHKDQPVLKEHQVRKDPLDQQVPPAQLDRKDLPDPQEVEVAAVRVQLDLRDQLVHQDQQDQKVTQVQPEQLVQQDRKVYKVQQVRQEQQV